MSTSSTGQFRARQQDTFTKVLLSVVGSLLVVVVISSVKLYADIRVMQHDLALMKQDSGIDESQQEQLGKLWRRTGSLRDWTNEERAARGAPPVSWPAGAHD